MITRESGLSSVVVSSLDPKPAGLFGALVPPSPGNYIADPNEDIYFRGGSNTGYGEFRWTPEPFDIKVLASYQEISTATNFDFEGSPAPIIDFNPKDQGAEIASQEFQIQSKAGGWFSEPFGLPFNWILGFYHFTSDNAGFRDLEAKVLDNVVAVPPGVQTVLNNLGLGNLPGNVDLLIHGTVNTESYAGYTQGSLALGDFSLTLGGRYTSEIRTLTESNVSVLGADEEPIPGGRNAISFPARDQSTARFTPRVSLDYHVLTNSLLYASYSKGFKSGTFNILNLYEPPQEIKPEDETTYEVGVKGNLLDGRLQFTVAGFQNDIKNLQVLFISLLSGGAITIENAGKARIRGADFDFTLQPFETFLPGLVFNGGGAYLDGKYLSYPDGSGFDPTTGLFFGGSGLVVGGGVFPGRDFTGNKTVRTPKFSGNLGLVYSFDAPGGNVEVGGGIYYNNGYFFSAQNTKTASQASYEVVNARVSYFNKATGLRLSFFGKNLTKDVYFLNKFETDFNTIGTLAPPREFFGKLEWTF